MHRRLTQALLFSTALVLTLLATDSRAATGWTRVGCWSPYPNCVGAKDVYRDPNGNEWECGACGTTQNPGPGTCYQAGGLHSIGYWCPRASS
jgi:hypothetical protein